MWRSWKIGSAFGIGLFIHWSFFLLPIWVFILTTVQFGAEAAAYCAGLVLVVFGCVMLHELGHALMARHFGVPTRDITLYPIGGVARLERMTESPWEEFWIALAGPAVNVVIATILIPLSIVLGTSPLLMEPLHYSGLGAICRDLGYMNLVLVLFNLLPAFPMDGGRVLRAVLAALFGRLTATEVAAGLGACMAGLFFLGGLLLTLNRFNGVMFMVISPCILLMGQLELASVRRMDRDRAVTPQVLPADLDVIDIGALPVKPNFSGFTWDGKLRLWVEWRDGRPIQAISALQNNG